MATINLRVDEGLKKDAENIFSELGLGMTSAITIFLKAVVRNNGIPFSLEIPNKNPPKVETSSGFPIPKLKSLLNLIT